MDKNKYIPLSNVIQDKESPWTFTKINIPYYEIVKRGIIMWCIENIEGRWTMLGGNKFGFENGPDATIFKLQFGLGLSLA